MDIDFSPFRGSVAVAAGLVTRNVLRGPRFRRLFPDVYVSSLLPVDLALRARAAALLVEGCGVVAGYAAAELLGASCGAGNAPVDVLLRFGRQRHGAPGLVVHRDRLDPTEIETVGGVPVTSPLRTGFDLARWASTPTERVVAVDALAYHRRVAPDAIAALARVHQGAHGSAHLPAVLTLVDGRSESPMESRIRMAIVLAGLPRPSVQHPLCAGGRSFRLDLAYPAIRLAIEYDGELHRTQRRARRDLEREALLAADGWTVVRFDAVTVLQRPHEIAVVVGRELAVRSVR